jgi:hypothetical protein
MKAKLDIELKTMTIEDLAPLLHRDPKTLMRDVHLRPDSLPPHLIIPHSKRILWLEQDVRAWLNDCRTKK